VANPYSFVGDRKLVRGCDICLFLESVRASIQELIGGEQMPKEDEKDDSWQSKICSNCKDVVIYCKCLIEELEKQADS